MPRLRAWILDGFWSIVLVKFSSHANCLAEARGLSLEPVARFGQRVESAPNEAIDGNHGSSHHHGGGQQQIEIALVGGLRDRRAQARRGVDVSLEIKVLGYDARVPSTPGRGHHAQD